MSRPSGHAPRPGRVAGRRAGLVSQPEFLTVVFGGISRGRSPWWRHGRQRRWRAGSVARRGGPGPERGSLSVELVVIAPALVLLLLLVAAGGRVVEAQGHIDGAARDAARAASFARSAGQAGQWAAQAAQADLRPSSWCTPGSVRASVAGYPALSAPAPGQDVTVTVSCAVNMSPFSLLGFSATKVFTSRAVAPLDEFVCRTGSCG